MKLPSRVVVLALLVFLAPFGAAQAQTASAILNNVEKGFEGIEDFEVTLEADVDIERVRVPKMQATMYFKKPDKVHFTSSSFVMLPREGIVVNPSLLRERYDASTLGKDTVDGRIVHKLQLDAKATRTRLRQMLLWVEPSNWTIIRMETMPYQGRALRLSFTYELAGGTHWLPKTLLASFETAGRDTTEQMELLQVDPDTQQRSETRRPMRKGTITVKYSDYRINVGLSDELFERQDRPVQR